MEDFKDYAEQKILGLEIAIECEEAVVEKLLPYRAKFSELVDAKKSVELSIGRRVRQLLESEQLVRDLKQDLEFYRNIA